MLSSDVSPKAIFWKVAKESFVTTLVIEDCLRRLRGEGNKCISIHAILDNFHAFGYKGDVMKKYKRLEWDSMWLTLESTCLQEMFIFIRGKRFKVGCRCCGEDITHMLGRDFTSISELLTILPFLAMFHRVLAPLRTHVDYSDVFENQFKDYDRSQFLGLDEYPYRMAYHTIVMKNAVMWKTCRPNIKPCNPIRQRPETVGSDHLILNAIINENKNRNRMGHFDGVWGDAVNALFLGKDAVSFHKILQQSFCHVLNSSMALEQAFRVYRNNGELELTDYDGSWESEENRVLELIASNAKFIMKVNWLHPSFPKKVPEGITFLNQDDQRILNELLTSASNELGYFHQVGAGLLELFLNDAEEGCPEANVYRSIPRVARLFAFSSANECENIFTQEGRRKKEEPYVYVVQSVVPVETWAHCVGLGLKKVIEEDRNYHLVINDGVATIEWVPEDFKLECNFAASSFLQRLEHGKWAKLSQNFEKHLKDWASSAIGMRPQRSFFSLNLLQPFQAKVTNKGNAKNEYMGLVETQLSLGHAYCEGTPGHQKAMEKITNACFLEAS